jgi:hypothetical protein
MKSFLADINIGEVWKIKPNLSISQAPQFQTTGALISIILKNVYVVAGILLLFLLLFGGISIILGAGGGDPKKTGQGQKAVIAALSGFMVIFASYWIIQIISFITGINILNP